MMEDDSLFELQNHMKKTALPKIDGYKILHEIGRGGMGIVYLAIQESLAREVAIKMISSDDSNTLIRKRFDAEAKAIASLKHPGITEIYDLAISDGKYYLSMEYLPGKGLEEIIEAKEVSMLQALKITSDVADILNCAHKKNVIHRDVKPSNIRIDISGVTKLLDFGLAKVNKGIGTLDGTLIGTARYMSPEQANGKVEETDCRSDIYSLGVVMYEMLTGQAPFLGNTLPNIVHQVVYSEVKKPSECNKEIDDKMENICLKAMNKNPEERYQTAEEFKMAIDEYLQKKPAEKENIATQISRIEQRFPPFQVKTWVTSSNKEKHNFSIGEKIRVHFESERDCYMYIVNIGPTEDVTVLYPNSFVKDNYVQGRKAYSFPREEDGFDFELQDPPGRELIYAIASLEKIDLFGVDWKNFDEGVYSIPREVRTRNIGIVAKKVQKQKSEHWSTHTFSFSKG